MHRAPADGTMLGHEPKLCSVYVIKTGRGSNGGRASVNCWLQSNRTESTDSGRRDSRNMKAQLETDGE